jgi:hypothetical protein
LGNLRADLLSARQALLADVADISGVVSRLIEEAKAGLDRLLG